MKSMWAIAGAVSIALLTAGCNGGGGGGLFSLFDGSSSSDDVLSAFTSGGGDGGSTELASLGSGGGDTNGIADSVAKLHNPEPASLALFGGGLAGLGLYRRRRSRKRAS